MGPGKTRCTVAEGRKGHCDSGPELRNLSTIVYSLSYSLYVDLKRFIHTIDMAVMFCTVTMNNEFANSESTLLVEVQG